MELLYKILIKKEHLQGVLEALDCHTSHRHYRLTCVLSNDLYNVNCSEYI